MGMYQVPTSAVLLNRLQPAWHGDINVKSSTGEHIGCTPVHVQFASSMH